MQSKFNPFSSANFSNLFTFKLIADRSKAVLLLYFNIICRDSCPVVFCLVYLFVFYSLLQELKKIDELDI